MTCTELGDGGQAERAHQGGVFRVSEGEMQRAQVLAQVELGGLLGCHEQGHRAQLLAGAGEFFNWGRFGADPLVDGQDFKMLEQDDGTAAGVGRRRRLL